MYQHVIDEMVELLANAGVITQGNKDKTNELLQKYWSDQIAIVWTAEDLRHANGEDDDDEVLVIGRKLTDTECETILQAVMDTQDAEVGVNWDSLRHALKSFKQQEQFQAKHKRS